MLKISVVSGGFDPIHSGHIEYLKCAKEYGDVLIVALNSDAWLIKKKGKFFMPFKERREVLKSINYVNEVISFEDDDEGSVINALRYIKETYPQDKVIFCNGGDRDKDNIPEMSLKDIEFRFGVGGTTKLNSSSDILRNYSKNITNRRWGTYEILHEEFGIKVKKLIIYPGKGMSLQRHNYREELWFVTHGKCIVNFDENDYHSIKKISLLKGDKFEVPLLAWHQLINESESECHILEIQRGERTLEDDIERIRYYEKE